jgi:hypothetical protein
MTIFVPYRSWKKSIAEKNDNVGEKRRNWGWKFGGEDALEPYNAPLWCQYSRLD